MSVIPELIEVDWIKNEIRVDGVRVPGLITNTPELFDDEGKSKMPVVRLMLGAEKITEITSHTTGGGDSALPVDEMADWLSKTEG